MGKRYLIDTNTLIDYLENRLPGQSSKLIDDMDLIQMSVISRIELLAWNKATNNQLQLLEGFIDSSLVFTLSEDIILKTIDIRRNYRIKLPDAIIAATALSNDLTLLTRNTSDFRKINNLACVDPYSI